jgi:hypothetical protein
MTMTRLSLIASLMSAFALSGCGAAPIGAAPSTAAGLRPGHAAGAPTSLASELGAPRRHTLAASATLWGLDVTTAGWVTTTVSKPYQFTWYSYTNVIGQPMQQIAHVETRWQDQQVTGYNVNYAFSGKGALQYLGGNRFLYTVPSDQVLVLNVAENPGHISLNGFPLSRNLGTNDSIRQPIHYVFGPDEVVICDVSDHAAISGYTADPSLVGGAGSGAVGSK